MIKLAHQIEVGDRVQHDGKWKTVVSATGTASGQIVIQFDAEDVPISVDRDLEFSVQ